MSRQLRFSSDFSRHYKVLERLGRGGAGLVFKCAQRELRRIVALKLVDPELFDDRVTMDRFAQEARVTAVIQHPNVLQVIDAGVDESPDGPLPFIVYEFVEGSDLGSALEKGGGRLPPDRALEVMTDVLRGLAQAHLQDPPILHRDIKPDNVLLASSGQVKVADFGIAKRKGHGPKTQTGMVVGTPTYMSPEQAQGLELGPTSDLYSTAVMAYECLAGRPPFVADSGMEVAVMHVRDEPPPPSCFHSGIPPEMDRILLKALSKDPRGRYRTADELADALQGARKAWPLWERRLKGSGATQETARPLEQGLASTSSELAEAKRVETLALPRSSSAVAQPVVRASLAPAAAPVPSTPVDSRTLRERGALAATGALLGVGALALLWLLGVFRSQDPTTLEARYAPLHVRHEAGRVAATLRWESREEYPTRVLVRRAGTAARLVGVEADPPTPTREHQIDLDGLDPGTEYEYFVVFPDQGRSLRYSFETLDLHFLRYPVGRLVEGGALEVRWRLSGPARALVNARVQGASGQAAEVRRINTQSYGALGEVSIPGFAVDQDVEFQVLLYTRWWDEQADRGLEDRSGPELLTPYVSVRSLASIKRDQRDRLAEALRALPAALPVGSLAASTPAQRLEAKKKVELEADRSDFLEAKATFVPDLEGYFESPGVDWAERLAWYRDVVGFHDWVQGLDSRQIPNIFLAAPLYPRGLRPLGTESLVARAGPFAKELQVPYQDREDPDFVPRVTPERTILAELPGQAARAWSSTELAVTVEGLDPGEVVRVDLGGRYKVSLRPPRGVDPNQTLVLYHQIPAEELPYPLEVSVGMYTAPGSPGTDGVRVPRLSIWGRPP